MWQWRNCFFELMSGWSGDAGLHFARRAICFVATGQAIFVVLLLLGSLSAGNQAEAQVPSPQTTDARVLNAVSPHPSTSEDGAQLAFSATGIATGEFFASDSFGNLYKVNTVTGAATFIGNMGTAMTDIAFSPYGDLFGVTFTHLYRIEPNTAAITLIGSLGVSDSNALAFDINGTLYMATRGSTLLRTVNTTTGATTVVGDMGVSSSGDLAFDGSSGNLFLSVPSLTSLTDDLYRVNPSMAVSTMVGHIGFEDVFGIDFSGGTLFGLTNGGELITIDTTSGAGTLVANTGVAATGASTALGIIRVRATLDGAPWFGAANYTLSGPTTFTSGNQFVSVDFLAKPSGTYTLTYNSGGPTGASLSSITPSATQILSAGLSIMFLLNFFSTLPPPPDQDTDGDGMPDAWEVAHGLNPNDPSDTGLDFDGDGVTNLQEYERGTNPRDSISSAPPKQNPPAPTTAVPDVPIDRTLPTIVLTHGLQSEEDFERVPDSLWTGLRDETEQIDLKKATSLILSQTLGSKRINIIRYVWKDAFQVRGRPNRFEYYAARIQAESAGSDLASKLINLLGREYDQPIHFIGHSLGTVVNAYGANLFLKNVLRVHKAQFTALDYPHHVKKLLAKNDLGICNIPDHLKAKEISIPKTDKDKICGDQFEETFGIRKDFFAALLQDLRTPMNPLEELRIDNYYVDPETQSWAGVGDIALGPIFNYKLINPNDVGGKFFEDETTFGPFDNDHTGVHQWYRWTIDPNAPPFVSKNDNRNWCNDESWTPSAFFDHSLNPCTFGWNRALNGRHHEKNFPEDQVGDPVTVDKAELQLGAINRNGCDTVGRIITCKEQSSPFLIAEVNLPDGAEFISFNYRFVNPGDGDYAAVFLDDTPIWTVAGSSYFGEGFLDSGPIPTGGRTGLHKLTIALYGVGEKNAHFEMESPQVIFVSNPPAELLTVSSTTLPPGETGIAYAQTLQAEGGMPPYIWSLAGGKKNKLPKGLMLTSDGTLAGVPTKAKIATFTVKVTDASGASATQTLSMQVVKGVKLKTKKLGRGTVGVPYSATLKTSGGIPPLTFSLVGGALPPGLTLDSGSGQVSGTPTVAGTFEFVVQVTSSGGSSAQRSIRIKIK